MTEVILHIMKMAIIGVAIGAVIGFAIKYFKNKKPNAD